MGLSRSRCTLTSGHSQTNVKTLKCAGTRHKTTQRNPKVIIATQRGLKVGTRPEKAAQKSKQNKSMSGHVLSSYATFADTFSTRHFKALC